MDSRAIRATPLWTLVQSAIEAFVVSVVRDVGARDGKLRETAVAAMESSIATIRGGRSSPGVWESLKIKFA